MCKIIFIVNSNIKSKKNILLADKFIKAQSQTMQTQRDGFAVYSGNKLDRDMDYTDFDTRVAYKPSNYYCLHTRIATCGNKGVECTHLQTLKNGGLFAHNGTVAKFSNTAHLTDSQLFIEEVIKKSVNLKRIEELGSELGFSGKGVYIKDNKATVFLNVKGYWSMLSDSLIAFTTYKPDNYIVNKIYKTSCGMQFEIGEEKEEITILQTVEVDDEYYVFRDGVLVHNDYLFIRRTQVTPAVSQPKVVVGKNYQTSSTDKRGIVYYEDDYDIFTTGNGGWTRFNKKIDEQYKIYEEDIDSIIDTDLSELSKI